MTVAPDTYIAQTLALFGWRTAPAVERRTDRYPEVDLEEFAGEVDRVLLSSEPFHFKEQPRRRGRRRSSPGAKVSLIDGEMTSWYGARAIAGLDYLARYASA